jgi:hypothetical protein
MRLRCGDIQRGGIDSKVAADAAALHPPLPASKAYFFKTKEYLCTQSLAKGFMKQARQPVRVGLASLHAPPP